MGRVMLALPKPIVVDLFSGAARLTNLLVKSGPSWLDLPDRKVCIRDTTLLSFSYEADRDIVAVVFDGPDLPDWLPGEIPRLVKCEVEHFAKTDGDRPPSRRFDLEL
jgi:hypothetical protein